MDSRVRLERLWPRMDRGDRETLTDFFERWTYSWVTYSGGMSEPAKKELLEKLDEELARGATGLEKEYPEAASSPSAPRIRPPDMPSLPEEAR